MVCGLVVWYYRFCVGSCLCGRSCVKKSFVEKEIFFVELKTLGRVWSC